MTREASEADTLPAGSRLGEVIAGKYRLESLLGRGGMGEVYEARHVVVGRRFAIKFLHAHLASGRGAVSRFVREAQAAGALDSPHIAAVLDFDAAPDGSPFLVMEYLTGESLASLLQREGILPLRRALSILLQACEGLELAHRAGIVHRDLKPDNLFVTKQKDGTDLIKILDFGIAKLVDAEAGGQVTQSGAVLGTPFYMAPEQARGEKSVDRRVDIYALGVVAYQLFSGKRPHPGDGYNAILAHILTQPIAPLAALCPELPPALVAVVERALAFDPTQRHGSAALLASELAPFAGHELSRVDSHFDLRPAASAPEGLVTRATDAAPQSAAGTLESAIGEVPSSRAEERAPRRRPWAPVTIAVAALAVVVLKVREASPPQQPVILSSAPSAAAQGHEPSPPAAALVQRGALPSASSAVPAAPASAIPTPSTRASSPATKLSSSATMPAHRRATGDQSTFDEKNPY
jgi:serine/threonine-protein kinase